MKILVVSRIATPPTRSGAQYAILAQANALMKLGHEVHFLLIVGHFVNNRHKKQYQYIIDETKKYWKEKLHICTESLLGRIKSTLMIKCTNIFHGGNYYIDTNYHSRYHKFVNKLNEKYNFDVCIVNYFDLSNLLPHISIPLKAIHTHDDHMNNFLRNGHIESIRNLTPNDEAKVMQRCPHIFALQDDEANVFKALSPKSEVYTIYSIFKYHPSEIADNHNIMILSGSIQFNVNGIKWFVDKILPLIVEKYSDAKLIIGGSICKRLQDYEQYKNIELSGFIDDVEGFFKKGDVAINPIYEGNGLKIKTFESLSYDKVVMTHPHSKNGIYNKNSAPIFSSSNPYEWVDYLSSIWEDKNKISDIKKKNKEYLEQMNSFVMSEYQRFLNYKK